MDDLVAVFCPDYRYDRVPSIDLGKLHAEGIRGLLMDLDNTLVGWRSSDIPDEVCRWAEKARRMGFSICIVSNTRRYERLSQIAGALGAVYVTGVSKPRRGGFRRGAAKLGLKLAEVVVIGDQLLTDVLAAKRLGVKAIYVERMNDREFFITKINRNLERFIAALLVRSGKMPPLVCGLPEDEEAP